MVFFIYYDSVKSVLNCFVFRNDGCEQVLICFCIGYFYILIVLVEAIDSAYQ